MAGTVVLLAPGALVSSLARQFLPLYLAFAMALQLLDLSQVTWPATSAVAACFVTSLLVGIVIFAELDGAVDAEVPAYRYKKMAHKM